MAQRSQAVPVQKPPALWSARLPHLRADVRQRWWVACEPFWIPGLALLCLLIGHAVLQGTALDVSGKSYDYAQYAIAGFAFPAALFAVPWFWRWLRLAPAVQKPARSLLAAGALIWCALYLIASVAKYGTALMALPPLLALAQTALMAPPWRPIHRPPEQMAAIAVTAVVAWTIAIAFLLEIFVQPPVYLAGFAVAFVLACSVTWPSEASSRQRLIQVRVARDLTAFVVIAFMSLRADGLFAVAAGALEGQGALHHWAPWVGAAELVRQGGWLLWDVPSMYGFLSIVPLAFLPTTTPWQALYLLQAASFFVTGGLIYLIVRGIRPGWLNWVLALAAAASIPMIFATFDASAPAGAIAAYPNHGPYRYLWCLTLIAVLFWQLRLPARSSGQRALLAGGCIVWVVGVLWSPESAAYCTGVWLPAYAVLTARAAARGPRPWRTSVTWFARPVVVLAVGVGIVSAISLSGLRQLPDWLAYLDYIRGLGLEVLVAVNDPTGSALGLLLGFCLLATAAWHLGVRRGLPTRSLPLLLGLLGGFWATSLYGFTRAYVTLHPIAYVALLVMLAVVTRAGSETPWKPMLRSAAVPLLTLVLVSPLAALVASPLAPAETAADLRDTAGAGWAVEPLLPELDPELQALLTEAGIGPDAAIAYQGSRLGILLPPWRPDADAEGERIVSTRAWLPAHPAVSLAYVPEDRGPTYMRRFIDRVRRSGWLIQHKTGVSASPPNRHEVASGRQSWFFPVLAETHVPTRVFENDEWQLVWFVYEGRDTEVTRPAFLPDRGLPPLLPDVAIDGVPLAEQDDPPLWALPGAGFGWYSPRAGGRWISPRATLWLYSRHVREVSIRLRTSPGAPPLSFIAAKDETQLADSPAQPATLSLDTGWNLVELCLWSAPLAEEPSSARTLDPCAGGSGAMAETAPGLAPSGGFVTGIELGTSRSDPQRPLRPRILRTS